MSKTKKNTTQKVKPQENVKPDKPEVKIDKALYTVVMSKRWLKPDGKIAEIGDTEDVDKQTFDTLIKSNIATEKEK